MGRVKTYESIVKGNDISEPGIPESFKVLLKELQSLALDMRVLTENHEEISLKDLTDDGEDVNVIPRGDKTHYEEIDLGFDKPEQDESTDDDFKSSDLFDDFDGDSFNDDDFKSSDLFDDFDDLEDLDGDDDN